MIITRIGKLRCSGTCCARFYLFKDLLCLQLMLNIEKDMNTIKIHKKTSNSLQTIRKNWRKHILTYFCENAIALTLQNLLRLQIYTYDVYRHFTSQLKIRRVHCFSLDSIASVEI